MSTSETLTFVATHHDTFYTAGCHACYLAISPEHIFSKLPDDQYMKKGYIILEDGEGGGLIFL
jgi:hypothetical protein